MKVLVRFDGKAFVPQSPVDMPVGTEVEVEVEVPAKQSFADWMAYVERRGPLPIIDLENLDRGDLYP